MGFWISLKMDFKKEHEDSKEREQVEKFKLLDWIPMEKSFLLIFFFLLQEYLFL